jgi:hypothetical protein
MLGVVSPTLVQRGGGFAHPCSARGLLQPSHFFLKKKKEKKKGFGQMGVLGFERH